MKTKELIKRLQKADPTGEGEVCYGNEDILFIETLPAYYDGSLQVLVRDEKRDDYNVVGAKFVRTGSKVQIVTYSIEDAVYDNPELPVEFDQWASDRDRTRLDEWRLKARKLDDELKKDIKAREKVKEQNRVDTGGGGA